MSTSRMFDRPSLIEAFTEIGAAAVANGARIELTVYGGSAMLLAIAFRFATEDVNIAEIGVPWPVWRDEVVSMIAQRNHWSYQRRADLTRTLHAPHPEPTAERGRVEGCSRALTSGPACFDTALRAGSA